MTHLSTSYFLFTAFYLIHLLTWYFAVSDFSVFVGCWLWRVTIPWEDTAHFLNDFFLAVWSILIIRKMLNISVDNQKRADNRSHLRTSISSLKSLPGPTGHPEENISYLCAYCARASHASLSPQMTEHYWTPQSNVSNETSTNKTFQRTISAQVHTHTHVPAPTTQTHAVTGTWWLFFSSLLLSGSRVFHCLCQTLQDTLAYATALLNEKEQSGSSNGSDGSPANENADRSLRQVAISRGSSANCSAQRASYMTHCSCSVHPAKKRRMEQKWNISLASVKRCEGSLLPPTVVISDGFEAASFFSDSRCGWQDSYTTQGCRTQIDSDML